MSERELDRLAAACLQPSFPGHKVPAWVERWLERGLGGITLFAYNVRDREQLAELTAALRERQPELLVSIDEEGGDVTRLEADRGSSYPGNLALGAIDDVELTGQVASAIGADLARVGVNLNLAPVADVNSNPRNPVIGVRSFGSEPGLVARHVAAFVRGLQQQGIAACAKHFPGHGDTSADSHLELPVVGGELGPALAHFRAAIEAGAQAMMTGHLLVPALDDVPATVSRRVLSDLLRDELGFDGLVLTDALEMRAISAGIGVEEGGVSALVAGADALCLGHDLHEEAVEAVHAAILAAVRDGRLSAERLSEAAARVTRVARWASPTSSGAAPREVGADAARRALRVRDAPVLEGAPLVLELLPGANVAAGELAYGFTGLWPGAVGVRLHERPTDALDVLGPEQGRPVVVVARDLARHEWQRATVADVRAVRADAVVIETGLPDGTAAIDTYGAARVNLQAAVDRLRADAQAPANVSVSVRSSGASPG